MASPLLTLTTDFGEGSSYVAAMKGVLLSINPDLRIVDLSHSIPPQNIAHAAYFLADCLPYFPSRTIHVVVVDPGVGTERALLHVEARGQQLVAPDNGCWTLACPQPSVRRLADKRFWGNPVSATFHGRDILAPVGAYLSLGVPATQLGPPVSDWVRFTPPEPRTLPDRLAGEVVFIDSFGNLLTSIPGTVLSTASNVRIGSQEAQIVRTYGEAAPGSIVALVSSSGMLEIACVNGSAATRLGVGVGTPVEMLLR